MKESIELRVILNASPQMVYEAWLDSDQHSEMTGGEAFFTHEIGDPFTAWDGYITGENMLLIPNREIVQTWRTAEFEDGDEDSQLKISLAAVEDGTELTLIHTNIPEGQTQYEDGWIAHYFTPMKAYFDEIDG